MYSLCPEPAERVFHYRQLPSPGSSSSDPSDSLMMQIQDTCILEPDSEISQFKRAFAKEIYMNRAKTIAWCCSLLCAWDQQHWVKASHKLRPLQHRHLQRQRRQPRLQQRRHQPLIPAIRPGC